MTAENDLIPFDNAVEELLNSARLLEEHDFVTPFLIILYCTIDTMAWLGLPEGTDVMGRTDFIESVNSPQALTATSTSASRQARLLLDGHLCPPHD
jgi:hypothetical protein